MNVSDEIKYFAVNKYFEKPKENRQHWFVILNSEKKLECPPKCSCQTQCQGQGL